MRAVAFDTSMMGEIITGSPLETRMSPEVAALLHSIAGMGALVVIPMPVIEECEKGDPDFIQNTGVDQDPFFKLAPFDVAARSVNRRILKNLRDDASLHGQQEITSPRRLADIKIIAVSYVQNVQVIYAEDPHFKSIIRRARLPMIAQDRDDIEQQYGIRSP